MEGHGFSRAVSGPILTKGFSPCGHDRVPHVSRSLREWGFGIFELFFLVLAHLLRQVPLIAQLFDQVHLGFEKVDVTFLVLEQGHEQIA